MKKILFYLFLLNCCILQAQHNVGISLGIAQYTGDLTPSDKLFLYEPHVAVALAYQYQFHHHFAIESKLLYTQLSGSDHHFDQDEPHLKRNLHFRSPLAELSLNAVIYVLPFNPIYKKQSFSPFFIVGVAGFYFNPMAKIHGDWIELQPLGTEGQGLSQYPERQKYQRVQIALPFGIGFKFAFSPVIHGSLQFIARKTFTDYLDDVSQTYLPTSEIEAGNGTLAAQLSNRTYDIDGNQIELTGEQRGGKGNDWYFVTAFSITYRIVTNTDRKERPLKFRLQKWL